MDVLMSKESLEEEIMLREYTIDKSNTITGNGKEENKDVKEDEPQSSSEEEEANDEIRDVVGFGDAMNRILTQNVAKDTQPILAKRITARMREIQSDKKEMKTARLSAAEKREREQKDMALPNYSTAGQDRKLRMIATKGVVALFNAIEKHQHGKKAEGQDKKVKELSKDKFLDLLKASQQKTTEKHGNTTKSSWSVVQDKFMMDAKLKDWDNQHGTEVGRVQQKGDADVEAAENVAWNQAPDILDSDNDVCDDSRKPKSTKRRTSSSSLKTRPNAKILKQSSSV